MSLTLKNLRVVLSRSLKPGEQSVTRYATLADLVEVLKQEGAVVRQWHGPIALHPKGRPDLGDDLSAGSYLVLPLGDTP